MSEEFFNDGFSEIFDSSEIQTFNNNVAKTDRLLMNAMKQSRANYNKVAVPVTSQPLPVSDIRARVKQIKDDLSLQTKAAYQELKIVAGKAAAIKAQRIASGMAKNKAEAEYNLEVQKAKQVIGARLAQARAAATEMVNNIVKQALDQSLEYFKDVKFQYLLEIQATEKKIVDTQDLFKSGKLTLAAANAVVNDHRKRIQDLITKMKEVQMNGPLKTLDAYVGMGVIGKETANKIREQLKANFAKEVAAHRPVKVNPNISYDPVDFETGQQISPVELDKQINYMQMVKGDPAEIERLVRIRQNMRRPKTKIEKVQIRLTPQAREISDAGEQVYSIFDTARIKVSQYVPKIPAFAISGDEQPSLKVTTTSAQVVTQQAVNDTVRAVADLHAYFRAQYDKARAAGIVPQTAITLDIGAIHDVNTELNSSKQTGMTKEEMVQKLLQLRSLYEQAIRDLAKLTEGYI